MLQFSCVVKNEERRQQDLEDLQSIFEVHNSLVLEQLAETDSKNQFRDDILQEIAQQQDKLNETLRLFGHSELSVDECKRFQDSMKEHQGQLLARFDQLNEKIEVIEGISLQNYEINKMVLEIVSNMSQNQLNNTQNKRKEDYLSKIRLRIDDYVEDLQIGKGGFGEVYSARKKGLVNNNLAIKRVNLKSVSDIKQARDEIENEALKMYLLSSSSLIVHCYGFAHGSDYSYLIMELAPYGSIWNILKDKETYRVIPFEVKWHWITELVAAVAHIHSHKIVHKDIKADNILLFAGMSVKLCDFGLAVQLETSQSLTKGERVVGTTCFMDPKVAKGEVHSSIKSDIYSLGENTLNQLNISHQFNKSLPFL